MDGIPSTYPSSYPPPAPIPVPAGPGYDQQYDHAGQQYADAHYAAPAAAAAAMDPPNITYGYPPKAGHHPPQTLISFLPFHLCFFPSCFPQKIIVLPCNCFFFLQILIRSYYSLSRRAANYYPEYHSC